MQDATPSKSLVLIIGAGASKEANLPIGSELKHQIADAVNIQFDRGYQKAATQILLKRCA
jgi:hypothetical protein